MQTFCHGHHFLRWYLPDDFITLAVYDLDNGPAAVVVNAETQFTSDVLDKSIEFVNGLIKLDLIDLLSRSQLGLIYLLT